MNAEQGLGSQYHDNAYQFMLESLERTRRQLGRATHLSARDLLGGIRSLAEERFGPTAALVFEKWGIRSSHDFGHMAFELVSRGILKKREEDLLEHFLGYTSFRTLFEEEYFLAR